MNRIADCCSLLRDGATVCRVDVFTSLLLDSSAEFHRAYFDNGINLKHNGIDLRITVPLDLRLQFNFMNIVNRSGSNRDGDKCWAHRNPI